MSELEKENTQKNFEILEIIDVKFMQKLQDFFAETLNIALVSLYDDISLTQISNASTLCHKYTRQCPLGSRRCLESKQFLIKTIKQTLKPAIVKCHVGLTLFAIPVSLDDRYLACVIGGEVLTAPPDLQFFKKLAREFGQNEKEYVEEMHNLRVLPEEKIKIIVDLLYLVTNSIVAIAHTNKQMKAMGIDYKYPRNIVLEDWFIQKCGQIEKPISARELEVLKLITQGKNNNEIAEDLCISVHTAKAHVSSIIEKLGVEDRVQVAVKAIREGLI